MKLISSTFRIKSSKCWSMEIGVAFFVQIVAQALRSGRRNSLQLSQQTSFRRSISAYKCDRSRIVDAIVLVRLLWRKTVKWLKSGSAGWDTVSGEFHEETPLCAAPLKLDSLAHRMVLQLRTHPIVSAEKCGLTTYIQENGTKWHLQFPTLRILNDPSAHRYSCSCIDVLSKE